MTERASEILKRTPPTFSDFLFSANGKDPYSLRSLDKIWREAGVKAGIKIKLYNAVRHSLGCQLMDEGAHLENVRDIMGHTSTEMTRRYAHRVPARMKALLEGRGRVVDITTRSPLNNKMVSA